MANTTHRPALPAELYAAVYDFQDATSRHAGQTYHHDFGGHLHLTLTADHETSLYAVAVPDPQIAARIVVTGICPVCDPDGHAAVTTGGWYTVEHAMEA